LGLGLTLLGTIIVGVAMLLQGVVAFIVGMLIFGMGFNAAQQMRVAAADMFPPRLRAMALGFVATGSLIGLLISPVLIWISEIIAGRIGLEPIALPWLMVPTLILVGMVLVTFVQPDPKEIGMHLERYYPGYTPPPKQPAAQRPAFSARTLWRHTPVRLAIISNCAGQANMSIVMVLTSLVLAHHGHSLTAIAVSHMFHSAGMFGFTIPLGWLADRFGRERVMYPGVATTLIGAIFVTFGAEFWSVTLGTFLVGIGWAAANVASTALIVDLSETEHRGPRHRRQRHRRGHHDGAGSGRHGSPGRVRDSTGRGGCRCSGCHRATAAPGDAAIVPPAARGVTSLGRRTRSFQALRTLCKLLSFQPTCRNVLAASEGCDRHQGDCDGRRASNITT
jgi:MFS family permease